MYGGVKRWLSLTYEKSEIVERHRSVGFLVGICFIVNAITGSGIPFISNVFQRTGIITVGALFAIYSYIAVQSSLFIVSSMRAVPGNEEFRAAIEFTTLVDFFFGRRAYLLSLVFFVMSLMSNTIESVVITSQTIDSLYVNLFGSTCALGLSPFEFFCTSDIDGQPSPFGDRYVLLTLGFLVCRARNTRHRLTSL